VIWIGTSGYNYPEWRGSFYPQAFPMAKMLPYYAARLPTVEINATFYRLPSERVLAGWAAQTPHSFKLTLKASRRITHEARLVGCEPLVRVFCGAALTLGEKLGALLFQLPPSMKKNVELLDAFLGQLPCGVRPAFEFRHASWLDQEVYERLRASNAALCIADSERMSTPAVPTADFGYFRLRDEGYTSADIDRWAAVIQGHQAGWQDTFVYFKHEEEGKGPAFAHQLMARLGVAQPEASHPAS
jgi:uncharacterized protein YecE (DUF72 family)